MTAADALAGLEIVRHPAARRFRLSVDSRDGRVRLVIPVRARQAEALAWAHDHRGWIDARLAKLPAPWPIVPDMMVPVAGRDLRLDWLERHPRMPRIVSGSITIGGPLEMLPARLLRWLRREAQVLLDTETRALAAEAGATVARVGVGDPKSRWGSCSSSGDIRFSWRLILAPETVRRSIVAHEVAHRIHMHHGPAFHKLADALFGGDQRAVRSWLKRHGPRLHWFGRT